VRLIQVGLADGKDAVMITAAYLAEVLGVTTRGAAAILRNLERMGWIRRVGQHRGRILWRLCRLPRGGDLETAAWDHYDAIEALARQTRDYRRDILLSVLHPAWHYWRRPDGTRFSPLSSRTWLRLVQQHFAVYSGLGLNKRARDREAKTLDVELPGILDGTTLDLATELDIYAGTNGADDLALLRRAELAEDAAAWRRQVDEHRAAKAAAFEVQKAGQAVVRKLVRSIGPVPADRTAINGWVSGAKHMLLTEQPEREAAGAVSAELSKMLGQAGYTEAERDKIISFLICEAAAA
jgi:hypothetical protein